MPDLLESEFHGAKVAERRYPCMACWWQASARHATEPLPPSLTVSRIASVSLGRSSIARNHKNEMATIRRIALGRGAQGLKLRCVPRSSESCGGRTASWVSRPAFGSRSRLAPSSRKLYLAGRTFVSGLQEDITYVASDRAEYIRLPAVGHRSTVPGFRGRS